MGPKQAVWGTLGLMLLVLTLVAPKLGQLEKKKRTRAYLREGYQLAYEIVRYESFNDRFPEDQADLWQALGTVEESANQWTWINDESGPPKLYRHIDDQMQDYWIVFKRKEKYTHFLEVRVEHRLPFWNSGIVPNFGPKKSIEYRPELAMAHSGCN